MSFSAFNKRSQSSSIANTTHQAAQQSEISGTAGSVNGSGTLNMLDGGAIAKAFGFGDSALGFADSALEKAANLTTSLVSKQQQSSDAALKFAMDAGRSDVATMQQTLKTIMILGGIVAAGFVLYGWKK